MKGSLSLATGPRMLRRRRHKVHWLQRQDMGKRPQRPADGWLSSRTHWSTPLSPRATHRRLVGRQVTVDPRTRLSYYRIPPYLVAGYLSLKKARYSCKFSQGHIVGRMTIKAHSTLDRFCPLDSPYFCRSKHLRCRSVPPVCDSFASKNDFVVFLFLDIFCNQKCLESV